MTSWSDDEIEALRTAAANGENVEQIRRRLDRGWLDVFDKARQMNFDIDPIANHLQKPPGWYDRLDCTITALGAVSGVEPGPLPEPNKAAVQRPSTSYAGHAGATAIAKLTSNPDHSMKAGQPISGRQVSGVSCCDLSNNRTLKGVSSVRPILSRFSSAGCALRSQAYLQAHLLLQLRSLRPCLHTKLCRRRGCRCAGGLRILQPIAPA
jgi:hypothetical protein